MGRNRVRGMVVAFLILCYAGSLSMKAYAEETQKIRITEMNQIMIAVQSIQAKELPDIKATTVIVYTKDSPVLVTGETEDGWYRVSFQDKEGYVKVDKLKQNDLDKASMDKEMEAMETENKIVIEEVERYRAEARRSRIWGTIIILLVAGIFATGIISTVRAEKKRREEKEMDTEPENQAEASAEYEPEVNAEQGEITNQDIVSVEESNTVSEEKTEEVKEIIEEVVDLEVIDLDKESNV